MTSDRRVSSIVSLLPKTSSCRVAPSRIQHCRVVVFAVGKVRRSATASKMCRRHFQTPFEIPLDDRQVMWSISQMGSFMNGNLVASVPRPPGGQAKQQAYNNAASGWRRVLLRRSTASRSETNPASCRADHRVEYVTPRNQRGRRQFLQGGDVSVPLRRCC